MVLMEFNLDLSLYCVAKAFRGPNVAQIRRAFVGTLDADSEDND